MGRLSLAISRRRKRTGKSACPTKSTHLRKLIHHRNFSLDLLLERQGTRKAPHMQYAKMHKTYQGAPAGH